MVEGHDFSESVSDISVVETERIDPLDDEKAEIYEKAFKDFNESRIAFLGRQRTLTDLLIAGGYGDRDIVKAEFQGPKKHFVTKPSKNGVAG
jgi:hypothetical protein